MKTILLALFGLTLTPVVIAQDWVPFYPQDLSHYRYQDGDSTIRSVRIDSMRIMGTDSVYFLNQTVVPCDTCTGSQNKHSVIRGATGLGRSFTTDSVGDTRFTMRDSSVVLFKRDLNIGESWAIDTLRGIFAFLVSVDSYSVFGQADSIRTISIGSDTILLSQHHGLIQFPDSLSHGRRLALWGIENRGLGKKDLGYREIYDFEEGDVFYYAEEFLSVLIEASSYEREEYRILQRDDFPDSIRYTVARRNSSCPNLNGVPDSCKEVWVFSGDDCPMVEALDGELVPSTPCGGSFGIFFLSDGYSQMNSTPSYKSTSPDTFLFSASWFDPLISDPRFYREEVGRYLVTFKKGLGLTKYSGSFFDFSISGTLVGYIKGQDTVGTIYPGASLFTSIEEEIPESVIRIFPNPVYESLNLILSDPAILPVRCQIMDIRGKGIAEYNTEELNSQFPVQGYPKGLYLIQITDREGRVHREKILVQSPD